MCYICKKGFSSISSSNIAFDKKYHKVADQCHYIDKNRGAAHNIYNLRYKTPKEIPVVFNNDSKYDYHFMIKELAE